MAVKVKVPATFNICGTDFTAYAGENFDRLLERDGRMGGCNFTQHEAVMGVHSKCPNNIFQHTFWHELIHAFDGVLLGAELTESQVAALAAGLHQFMEQLGVHIDRKSFKDKKI